MISLALRVVGEWVVRSSDVNFPLNGHRTQDSAWKGPFYRRNVTRASIGPSSIVFVVPWSGWLSLSPIRECGPEWDADRRNGTDSVNPWPPKKKTESIGNLKDLEGDRERARTHVDQEIDFSFNFSLGAVEGLNNGVACTNTAHIHVHLFQRGDWANVEGGAIIDHDSTNNVIAALADYVQCPQVSLTFKWKFVLGKGDLIREDGVYSLLDPIRCRLIRNLCSSGDFQQSVTMRLGAMKQSKERNVGQ
ncbi:hypothetical protein CRG98_006359 [Punica granatum]|uniref:Uncharacterized protein n=1 Tax=Punica granatum TaxID=22663 RepID=A0A2I0KXN7_PUNGR|nr:hypothetical protein CRG98_006359 [Punica granatum]